MSLPSWGADRRPMENVITGLFLAFLGGATGRLLYLAFQPLVREFRYDRARKRWYRGSRQYVSLNSAQLQALTNHTERQLIALLPPDQRDQAIASHAIFVQGKRQWWLRWGHFSCAVSAKDGRHWYRLCVSPVSGGSGAEKALTMLLWITADEAYAWSHSNLAGYE